MGDWQSNPYHTKALPAFERALVWGVGTYISLPIHYQCNVMA